MALFFLLLLFLYEFQCVNTGTVLSALPVSSWNNLNYTGSMRILYHWNSVWYLRWLIIFLVLDNTKQNAESHELTWLLLVSRRDKLLY